MSLAVLECVFSDTFNTQSLCIPQHIYASTLATCNCNQPRWPSSIASVCPAELHWADSRSLSVRPPLAYPTSASAMAITDARVVTDLVPVSTEATTNLERGEGRSSSLILSNSASLDDASVCSPMKLIIRLLSVGLAVLRLMIGIYLPHESGQASPVEWVQLNESCWRVRLNESDWMSPSLVTPTAVRGPSICWSQRSAGPLTVRHTVCVSHSLLITVDDHSPDPPVEGSLPLVFFISLSSWFRYYVELLDIAYAFDQHLSLFFYL